MPITARRVRLLTPLAALVFLGLALLIRAVDDGALRQYSGTALYASMVWSAALFVRPQMAPMSAGIAATVFCWAVEIAQLTGVPAELSARSLAARLALGAQFDPVDLAWYPAGVVPLVALHHLVRVRQRRTASTPDQPALPLAPTIRKAIRPSE
ncbi:hypothetical protein GCM10028790_06400 [Micromonospora taraxaci]|uniref:Uncharacterized protein DUF2809 n=1 Tax=Micromonospora taraxaci TaxID=1316803 RepID=A0A561W761_9ACTN|nr:DUF2809 domain-containing protein [Micromonospora taraxaci]TWG19690.1 uncharacterized protein DUF2809 [Micromonospora taraxaci]